jgi:hypothetical protein
MARARSKSSSKDKLTLSIDSTISEKAKKVASNRSPRLSISNMVETYLTFLSDPLAWCFKCGKQFTASQAEKCKICNFMQCPKCKACGCKLQEETVVAVRNMRKVYKYLGAEVDE